MLQLMDIQRRKNWEYKIYKKKRADALFLSAKHIFDINGVLCNDNIRNFIVCRLSQFHHGLDFLVL